MKKNYSRYPGMLILLLTICFMACQKKAYTPPFHFPLSHYYSTDEKNVSTKIEHQYTEEDTLVVEKSASNPGSTMANQGNVAIATSSNQISLYLNKKIRTAQNIELQNTSGKKGNISPNYQAKRYQPKAILANKGYKSKIVMLMAGLVVAVLLLALLVVYLSVNPVLGDWGTLLVGGGSVFLMIMAIAKIFNLGKTLKQ